jgi:putative glycosyltransferase (TIGR04372 family)
MDELRNKLQISSTIKLALVAFSEKEYYSTGFGRKAGDRFSVQEDFDAAVKILVASGHATLRIGAAVGPLAEALVDLGMIDYARSARNEKNDVALARACKLMIADASGAWWMTVPFSKQVLITNQYRIRNSLLGPEVTCLPALYWSRNSRRLLTLAEMFKLPKHPTWRDPSLEFVRCDRDAISQAVSNLLTPQESNSEAVERSEAIRRKISEMSGLNKLEFVCSIDPSFSLRHWDDLKI